MRFFWVCFWGTSAVVCSPAHASATRCARWIATGAVGMATMMVAPPVAGPAFVAPRSSAERTMPFETPWREYTFDLSQRFFDGTSQHRSLAKVINQTTKEDEADRKLRDRLDGEAEFLLLELRAVAFWRRGDQVQLGWVTKTQEAVFPTLVPLAAVESGDPIEVTGKFVRKGSLGEVRGFLTLVVRFDGRTQRLVVERATCRLEVSTLFGAVEDEATLGPATAASGEGERLPRRTLD